MDVAAVRASLCAGFLGGNPVAHHGKHVNTDRNQDIHAER
jgi:hypothetical protein